ncbi:MAG: hypothetical protein H6738_10020 [Alphaproteobacteria bacterium]|nr:hypothetical protein [Alphaproteobacteria bacterium]
MWWTWMAAWAADGPIKLSKEVARVNEEVRLELAPDTCVAITEAVFHDLANLRPDEVDRTDLARKADDVVLDIFRARLATQAALTRFAEAGELEHDCVTGVRRADLASRYLVDQVYEALPDDTLPGTWLVAGKKPRFAKEHPELRTGDVLVTRATALSSAGIAHLGGIDSQFSHNALVYVDEAGKAWTVEAYMERGALVQPVEDFLADGLGRVVILRHHDAALAAEAAAAAYDRVAHGPFIPYDDLFLHDDGDRLFCSEVARWAYGSLIGRPNTIPWDLTRFPRETNARFFDAMGIEGSETSMPADILYDPSFDIVAEWRDPAELPRMRRHDAIAESAYRWMEEEGYEVDPSAGDAAFVTVGLTLRRLPVLSYAVRDRLLPTSNRDFLVTGLAFDTAGRVVDEELVRRKGEGRNVTRTEWLEALEAMRLEDLSTWEGAPKDAAFHTKMHPGGDPAEVSGSSETP